MTILDIGLLVGHPVLPRKYLHNCLKKVLNNAFNKK